MSTTWTEIQKYEGAPSTTYDDSSVTYDDARYNYEGQFITTWVNESKS